MNIYAYGNVDALHGIFNAVAMIMNSADFSSMIRVAVLIGFAVVATLAAFPGNLGKSWSWFLSVTVISGVMLVPKTQVTIVDKLGQQAPVVVANVPWSLALLASVKSSIGATLTELFETAFQTIPAASRALPAELSYLEHGMMFGSRLVQKSREAEPLSVYAKSDLVQYIRNCIFPEQGRAASANAMEYSADLATTFGGMNNPALSSTYHNPANGFLLVSATCDVVWARLLPSLNAAGAEAVRRAAQQTLPTLYGVSQAQAIAKLEGSISAIYTKAALGAAAATASQIMQQNILINATAEASAIYGASLNDPATMMFSSMQTQAVQQMNAGNMVQGRIAEEALPIIRNITEGILFAVFPVLCILMVASEGKALAALFKSYVYVLLWVELWPPMFAIVNYLQTLEAAKTLAGAGYLAGGGTGLTLGTATPIFSASVSTLATSAWMVTFVPVIAAAVLFGFDKMLAITGAAAGGQRAAQSEASQATKGNLQAGNVTLDQQQLAAYKSDPAMVRQESLGGVSFENGLTGLRLDQARSEVAPVTLSQTAAITRGMAAEASVSMQQAHRYGRAADQAMDVAYTTALGVAQSNSAAHSRTLGWDVSKVGSNGVGATDVEDEAKKIATAHGIKDTSVVAKAISVGMSGLPIPLIGASGKSESGETLAADIAAGVDNLKRLGAQRKRELVDQYRTGEGFEESRRSNRDATQRVESSAREAKSLRQSEQTELARSQQLSAKVEAADRFSRESTSSYLNLLGQYARAKFGMSVHDGIADPRRWEQVVKSFVMDGHLVRGDDGKHSWMPPDPGLGAQALAPTLLPQAESAAAAGEGGLRDAHSRAEPQGSESTLDAQRVVFDKRVGAEQSRLGVKPDGTVTGAPIKQSVAAGQSAAQVAVEERERELALRRGQAQVTLDKRAEKVSDFHTPMGDRQGNQALNATRSSPPVFGEESAEEKARVEREAVAFAAAARKVQIPHQATPRAEIPHLAMGPALVPRATEQPTAVVTARSAAGQGEAPRPDGSDRQISPRAKR